VDLTDELLMVRMTLGDADALTTFVRRFHARVYGLALSVVGDPGLAEEVAQDAFLRTWRQAATYDPRRARVATWLLTITRNLAVDAIRARRDLPVDPGRLMGTLATRVEHAAYDTGTPQLRAGLRSLPAEQARTVMLAVGYGWTAREIADRDGIPLGTAKTRIRRGLARLRRELGEMGRELDETDDVDQRRPVAAGALGG
jgi:RNA polymerase sigma factor (sigma-70 family)